MIHSFRDSSTSDFPNYLSDEAVEALEKMKEIKEKTSDNESFNLKQEELWKNIYKDRFTYIFFRAWYSDDIRLGPDQFNKTVNLNFAPLPGKIEGVSGSCIGGSNIALSKYVSEEKKRAAIEIYKYLFSYEFQKHLILNASKRSAIHSLYQDRTICQKINCAMYSNMQGIVRPSGSIKDYPKFSEKFYNYVKEYVIDGKYSSAREVLQKIDNINSLHYVEYNSVTGLVILSTTVFVILLILFSYIYISIKRLRKQFNFVPFNYWCCFLFGNFLLMCSCISAIGNFKDYACTLREFFVSLGFTLTYVPFLIKLVSLFPRKNEFINFVNKDHNTTFIGFILLDVILNMIWVLFDPLKAQKYIVEEGENFLVCRSDGKIGRFIIILQLLKGLIIMIMMAYLIVSERDVVLFKSDVVNLGYSIYFNLINYVIYMIVYSLTIDNRYPFYGLRCGITMVFCLFNLAVIIFPKFYEISINKEKNYSKPDINKFIKKTGAFNNRGNKKELDFINVEDFVEIGLVRKSHNDTTKSSNYQKYKNNENGGGHRINNKYENLKNNTNYNNNINNNNSNYNSSNDNNNFYYTSNSSGYKSDSTIHSSTTGSTFINPSGSITNNNTVTATNNIIRNMYNNNNYNFMSYNSSSNSSNNNINNPISSLPRSNTGRTLW